MYGAYRPAEPGTLYYRIAHFLFPFWTMIPTGVLGHQIVARAWVPMDDEHTMFFIARRGAAASQRANAARAWSLQPNTSDWYGRFRMVSTHDNDYRIDREWQRDSEEYTGIAGIHTAGPGRDREHGRDLRPHPGAPGEQRRDGHPRPPPLAGGRPRAGRSGLVPLSVDAPRGLPQRSGGVLLPEGRGLGRGYAELRQAYRAHPELDPALAR